MTAGPDIFARSVRGAAAETVRRMMPKAPVVGVVVSIGQQVWNGPLVANVSGVLEGLLPVPQKSFSSWFLHEATMGDVTGLRVLVLFTEGNQLVLMSTLPPIGA